jgi:HlyD family secretion protein
LTGGKETGFLCGFKAMGPDKETLDGLRINRPTAPGSRVGGGMILVVVVCLVLIAGVVWWLNRPKSTAVRTVVAQRAASGGPRTLLNASGYVTARRQSTVSSKVTGKVVEVLVEEGMKVEAGQILARVDPSNVEKGLRLAQAQLEAARKAIDEIQANLEQAERELRRSTELATHKVTSQSVLDQADAEAKSLRARLEKQKADVVVAEREVAQWEQQLDDTIIRSPFAGIVTLKNAQPGEMISPMSAGGSFTRTGICTLVDMNSLEIEVDVNESYINRVEPGQRVEATLDAYPDWHIPAKVIAIIPAADRQKATVKVRVGFEKLDKRILPDMGVKVAFQAAEGTAAAGQQSVSVPKAAVQQQDGRQVVWVVKDNRVERRAVTVGAGQNNEAVILAGLNGGEHVVIEGPPNLIDGAPVKELHP